MADAKLTALTAASALAAADLFYVSQSAASRKATGTQFLTLVGTEYVAKAGATMTGALTLSNGTAAAPTLNFASALTSGLYAIGNALSFSANGARHMYMSGSAIWVDVQIGFLNTNGNIRFGSASASDPILYRFADGALYLRPSATSVPCAFQISTLYTDASNYERLTLTGVAGTSVNITAETLGTGGDNLDIVLTPAGSGSTIATGPLQAGSLVTGGGAANANGFTVSYYAPGIRMSSTCLLNWATTSPSSGADAGFARGAAGQVDVTNGTAGTYRDLKLRNLLVGGGDGSYVQTPSMKVTNLAAAEAAGAGARAFVTDADATTFLSTVHGGGSYKVPVVSDGTNWLIG